MKLLKVVTTSIIIYFVGFIFFIKKINNFNTPNPLPKADGIVVWTGKGGGRLEAGAHLLLKKKGERLLISGVNSEISLDEIKEIVAIPEKLSDCCLDLDYEAKNTIGNAYETTAWAKALGFKHVILVTSAYHMPRAEIEMGAATSQIKVTPFPVLNQTEGKWYLDSNRLKRLLQEYTKLLISYLKYVTIEPDKKKVLLNNNMP
jgi:uncharacterized SAM-binding protein YcdF (DUF218 family)